MKRAIGTAVGIVAGLAVVVLVLQLAGVDLASVVKKDVDKGTVIGKLTDEATLTTAARTYRATVQRKIECQVDLPVVGDFVIPQELCGRELTFNVDGEVRGEIDLSAVDEQAVSIDGDTVTVTLPPPTPGDPTITNIDLLAEDRGGIDRVNDLFAGDPDSSDFVLRQGGKQLLAAASKDDELLDRAKKNAEELLTTLLKDSGVDKVVVEFSEPPRAST